jgi:hypothetical protein
MSSGSPSSLNRSKRPSSPPDVAHQDLLPADWVSIFVTTWIAYSSAHKHPTALLKIHTGGQCTAQHPVTNVECSGRVWRYRRFTSHKSPRLNAMETLFSAMLKISLDTLSALHRQLFRCKRRGGWRSD